MASSATHAQASAVSGAYLPFKDACSKMLEDAGFTNDTEGSVICLKMAHDFLCLLDNPNWRQLNWYHGFVQTYVN